ncbi:MAG: hypothetical protein GY851_07480 [bacterium]|nr:hypothetical protein [bacterium]
MIIHRRLCALVAVAAILVPGCSSLHGGRGATPERPLLLATYYTWYATKPGPHGVWAQWGNSGKSLLAPSGTNPDNIILPPHIRDISSCAYPLIGVYDSGDPEVVRWHMRLAKAAGIDALMVDWWGPAGWQTPSGLTHDVFVDVVLPIAEEEGMKVCLFDETAQFVDDFDTVKEWAATYLGRFKGSPAYLHIDGKPVYAIYQVPFNPKLTPEQAVDLRDYVEARVGPVYWVFDKIANGDNPLTGTRTFVVDPAWLALDWIDAFMGYGTFSVLRKHTYDGLAPQFDGMARVCHHHGHKAMLPVHPGHDNSKIQEAPYVIPRDEGETLRGYLRAVTDAKADAVVVTSFNEWPETTVVEPARTWDDPYLYLRILAEWKGKRFVPPPLPKGTRED